MASFAWAKESPCSFPKTNKAFCFIRFVSGWSSSAAAGKNDQKKFKSLRNLKISSFEHCCHVFWGGFDFAGVDNAAEEL